MITEFLVTLDSRGDAPLLQEAELQDLLTDALEELGENIICKRVDKVEVTRRVS